MIYVYKFETETAEIYCDSIEMLLAVIHDEVTGLYLATESIDFTVTLVEMSESEFLAIPEYDA